MWGADRLGCRCAFRLRFREPRALGVFAPFCDQGLKGLLNQTGVHWYSRRLR